MNIGENIRKYRKKANLTQKKLAELCGLATGTIQQYELGKRQPRLEQISTISEILNVSMAELTDSFELLYDFSIDINDTPVIANGAILPDVFNIKELMKDLQDSKNRFLTDTEKLFIYFNSLNTEGQEKAFDMIETLLEIPKYRNLSKD